MNRFKWKMLKGILVTAAVVTAFFSSCQTDPEDDPPGDYQEATAKVDYNGTGPNSKRAVFFKFSTGVIKEVPLDFFDIAIATTSPLPAGQDRIIANSGSYGAGVLVFATDNTNIADTITDPSSTTVRHFTFRNGYDVSPTYIPQSVANPVAGAITGSGAGDGKVYAIKTGAGTWFKVKFNSFGPQGQYSITVVEGLDGTTEATISGGLGSAAPYGYVYFDLDTKAAIDPAAAGIPKADGWDILCTRTDDIVSNAGSPYYANRSSILINSAKGVTAAKVEGKNIEEVLQIPAESAFSSTIDTAIGYSWYSTSGMPPTMSAATNTYVVKTVEGTYVKFQPGSFYGPNSESFYMSFRYYAGDNSGTFDK